MYEREQNPRTSVTDSKPLLFSQSWLHDHVEFLKIRKTIQEASDFEWTVSELFARQCP